MPENLCALAGQNLHAACVPIDKLRHVNPPVQFDLIACFRSLRGPRSRQREASRHGLRPGMSALELRHIQSRQCFQTSPMSGQNTSYTCLPMAWQARQLRQHDEFDGHGAPSIRVLLSYYKFVDEYRDVQNIAPQPDYDHRSYAQSAATRRSCSGHVPWIHPSCSPSSAEGEANRCTRFLALETSRAEGCSSDGQGK